MIIPACVSGLVFWSPLRRRGRRVRPRAPVSMLPRVQTVGGARWAMRACHRFDGSRPRGGNHSNVSTAPRAHNPPGDVGAALGDTGCNSAASTAIEPLCLRDMPRTLRLITPQRGCRCVLVRLQTLARNFYGLCYDAATPSHAARARFRRSPASLCSLRPAVLHLDPLRTRCVLRAGSSSAERASHGAA